MAPSGKVVLADASALVAVIDKRDHNHDRCRAWLGTIGGGELVTTCAAFAEAMHLLGRRLGWPGRGGLWDLVERAVLHVAHEPADPTRVFQLMSKYRDIPMALADAQLMELAEEWGGPPIFTLDSDFRIYRLSNGAALQMVP